MEELQTPRRGRGRASIRRQPKRYNIRRLQFVGLCEVAQLMIPGGTEDEVQRQARILAVWLSRRNGNLPEPDAHLASGPVWRRNRIERWLRRRQGVVMTPMEEMAATMRQEILSLQDQLARVQRLLPYVELRIQRARTRRQREAS